MIARGLALLLLLLACAACDDNRRSDNADSVSGPGIDIHCANLLPGQGGGVGNTSTHVTCAQPQALDP